MFERFTERARQVVVLAQEESRALSHTYIGTEHILLGLLREEDGIAARVLEGRGIDIETVRARVSEMVGPGDEVTTGQVPFTPRAKKVLELALREALSLGHNYIGTEHVLLGLAREGRGLAVRILADLGAPPRTLAGDVLGMLGGGEGYPGYVHTFSDAVPERVSTSAAATVAAPMGVRASFDGVGTSLVLGWGLFGVAFGVGLLAGWLIWG